MQIVSIVVVLGAVSWVVCVVSLQGETSNRLVGWGRLGNIAQRASSRVGSLRIRVPAARRALVGRASTGVRATFAHLSEARQGLAVAARAVWEGFREDAAWLRDQLSAGWQRLAPILRPYWMQALSIAGAVSPAARTLAGQASTAVKRARVRATAAKAERKSLVAFAESFSVTALEELPDGGLPRPTAADEGGHRVRGVLGLIVLIALLGLLIAAGLMSAAWGVRHLMVRGA